VLTEATQNGVIMKWSRVALAAQIGLAIYFQAMEWLPLGRWNYQPGFEPLATQAVRGHLDLADVALVSAFALPLAIFYLAYRKKVIWLQWIALVGYAVWLVLQIQTWWVAYIFGASDRWASVYHRVFSQSTKILPSFGRHLAPDGMHFVLQLLLVAVTGSLLLALLSRRSRGDEPHSG
jgi:hypothetical protein